MATNVRHHKLLIAIFLAVALFAPLQVGAPSVALAATACPARLGVVDSMSNTTLPAGVPEIKTALGGVKTVNQGFGKAPGGFAYTYNGVYYDPFHRGIDFNDVYQKIYSPWPAKIANYVGGGWGTGPGGENMVVAITLSNGYTMYILHLSDFGATGSVKAGTYIGTTGNTGFSSGPHSHIEMDGPGGEIIPPEWWACKSGAPAGSPGVTDSTATVSGDIAEDGSTLVDKPLPVPPWILQGTSTSTTGVVNSLGQIVVDGGGAGTHVAAQDTTSGDGSVAVDLVDASPTAISGVQFRIASTTSYMVAGLNGSGQFGLFKVEAGSYTTLALADCGGCVPGGGGRMRVSYQGDQIKLYYKGVQVAAATSSYNATSKRVGLFSRHEGARTYDNFQYTTDPSGALSTPEAGAEAATSDGNEDSGWNPMAWLWDKVRGLLVPSETDWQEIGAELDKLTDREPIGTLKDVAQFAGSIKGVVSTAPTGTAAPLASGGQCNPGKLSGLFCTFTFGSAWAQAIEFSGTVAAAVDTFQVAGLSGTTFIKVSIDVIAAFSVWDYLNSRTVLAA